MILDSQQIQSFLPLINSGLVSQGYTGVSVLQNYQPTMQGAYTGPTVYFFKVSDYRYGFLGRSDTWDSINKVMVHTEKQWRETIWQFSAFVTADLTNVNSYTASDLCNVVAQILASDSVRIALQNDGFGQYRIGQVRNPYFTDERDLYESFPSFDFTLCFQDITISNSNVITPPITYLIRDI